jgi:hypothetical protein
VSTCRRIGNGTATISKLTRMSITSSSIAFESGLPAD